MSGINYGLRKKKNCTRQQLWCRGKKKRAQGLEVRRPVGISGLRFKKCDCCHNPSEPHFTLQNRVAIPRPEGLWGGLY